ncbi:uncharacterized protein [Watersipora subatra]|uniref:uncharacterized protein isoform X2 n=1 Tax=Watersipora subatra TaxID=2589382 RepID=UPI00355C53D2
MERSPVKLSSTSNVEPMSPHKRSKRTETSVEDKENLNINYDDRTPVLRFAKLTEHAMAPTRGSKMSAGYDLYSAYDCLVPAKGKCLVKTDIQIELPQGCYGRVAPRSGLAHKHFLDTGAGVIDADYRGNVGVILFNFNTEDYQAICYCFCVIAGEKRR